jgi:acyl-CoA thioesterase FadM
VSFGQHIYRSEHSMGLAAPLGSADTDLEESRLLASAAVRVACVHAQTYRPQRLPDFLINALGAQERS